MAYCAVKKKVFRIISKQERQLCLLLQASAAVSCVSHPVFFSRGGIGDLVDGQAGPCMGGGERVPGCGW